MKPITIIESNGAPTGFQIGTLRGNSIEGLTLTGIDFTGPEVPPAPIFPKLPDRQYLRSVMEAQAKRRAVLKFTIAPSGDELSLDIGYTLHTAALINGLLSTFQYDDLGLGIIERHATTSLALWRAWERQRETAASLPDIESPKWDVNYGQLADKYESALKEVARRIA